MIDLSVVMPVHNGESFILESIGRLEEFLQAWHRPYEIVVVDDGSSDSTAALLSGLKYPSVRSVRLSHNSGKYAALKRGMDVTSGRCRIFTDADLPYELPAIPYICDLINNRGFHIVMGDRTLANSEYSVHLSAIRSAATEMFSFFVRLLVTGGLFDTQCGLKGFQGDVAGALFPLVQDDSFSGDVELLYIALKYNLVIRRIPVRLRRSGPSSVRVFRHACQMLARISKLRRNWKKGYYYSERLVTISDQSYWSNERPHRQDRVQSKQ